jgi:hypothetical protein
MSEKRAFKGEIIDRFLYKDPASGEKVVYEHDVPFYKKQMRLIFGMNGHLDPTSIDDYLSLGGYSALAKVLKGHTGDYKSESSGAWWRRLSYRLEVGGNPQGPWRSKICHLQC